MEAIERIWLGVQLQSLKRTTVGWRVAGRSGGAAPFLRVSLATSPTLRQQQAAAEEDVEEHGRHVCSRRAGSAQMLLLELATKFFHQMTGECSWPSTLL